MKGSHTVTCNGQEVSPSEMHHFNNYFLILGSTRTLSCP